jgi:hypothetical protein
MGFMSDAFQRELRLSDVVRELGQLADQAVQLKQELAVAAASTRWSGSAANGFRARAQQREGEVAALVGALDSAHAAVSAAHSVAGVF